MAERRMFSSKVVCSDAFAGMPFSAQALYVQLCMEADDDGFLNRAKRIQGSIGASDKDLNLLFEKRFILGFPNGVIAIKHWRMNNQIRKDRYTSTQYQEEFNSLVIQADGSYTEKVKNKEAVNDLATTWQPDGNHLEPQYSIGKDSIGEESIDDICVDDTSPTEKKSKPVKHKYGEYNNVLLTDDELEKLKAEYPDWEERIERLSSYVASTGKSYKSHYATIRNWARKDQDRNQQSVNRPGYTKQTKAEELDNFYGMAREWAENG